MAQATKDKFLVLDLLQLDLRENDALDLKCIGGRPGLIREISVKGAEARFKKTERGLFTVNA